MKYVKYYDIEVCTLLEKAWLNLELTLLYRLIENCTHWNRTSTPTNLNILFYLIKKYYIRFFFKIVY